MGVCEVLLLMDTIRSLDLSLNANLLKSSSPGDRVLSDFMQSLSFEPPLKKINRNKNEGSSKYPPLSGNKTSLA